MPLLFDLRIRLLRHRMVRQRRARGRQGLADASLTSGLLKQVPYEYQSI